MDEKKQRLLIEYLISSPDTFAKCQGIVDSKYFDPEFRSSVEFIKQYYDEFRSTPDTDMLEAETGQVFKKRDVTHDQIQYTSKEVESFCRRKAIEHAVINSVELIKKGDYGMLEKSVRDAVMISLHDKVGLRYFDTVDDRLERMMVDNPVISTGWKDVDELLFGGIARKELLLVSASSGGGKSITLANLAFNFSAQGYHVLYLSLELSEDVVAQRFDTMFTGVSRRDWKDHISEIKTKLSVMKDNFGPISIIQMPSGTKANDIKAYLKEYELTYKRLPDLLVIDYLDKMNPNEKVDLTDVWTKDKLVSEQARDIGVEYNMAIATASQLNREAHKATRVGHEHIAGGISKINESDVYWSIELTDVMKAKGECAFLLQKTRNSDGVGESIYLKWDAKHLRIIDSDRSSRDDLKFVKREQKNSATETSSKTGLLDLMSSVK